MDELREFILSEISDLEAELHKAQTFAIQAQAAIDTHRVILKHMEGEQSPSVSKEDECQ